MLPHRSLNFSIVFPPHQFPSFYFYFTWNHFPSVLLKMSIPFPLFYMLSIYPSISSIFPVFCHGVTRFLHHYPYVTPVCLTLTQMHLPQSLQLHRINGFARFFNGFLSVLLLHSGHTSKTAIFPLFFHCFTRALRDNGPTSEPQFYLASFYPLPILSTIFPRGLIKFPSVLLKFSIAFPCFSIFFVSKSLLFSIVFLIIFPSFPIFFPLFYVIFPHFFYCFSHHFPLHCNLPKSTSEGGPGGNRYPTVTQLPPGT